MWTPRLSSNRKAFLKEHPIEGDGTEESEVSSSSSSSSSSDSSDDEQPIDVIRNNCYTPPEISELIHGKIRYKFILMMRHINRLIKAKVKAENHQAQRQSASRASRSRSSSPKYDVQYSGGQVSETSSLRMQKHF